MLSGGGDSTLVRRHTFGAVVGAVHVEDPVSESDLLKYNAKAVDVSFLGPLRIGGFHAEELRSGPQPLYNNNG